MEYTIFHSNPILSGNLENSQNNLKKHLSTSPEEHKKSKESLVALKEQLKAQIQKQAHGFSNPNQPSSQIEADEIQYPISANKALKLFMNNLTDYEKGEILDYEEIYFLGLNAPKIKGSSLQ